MSHTKPAHRNRTGTTRYSGHVPAQDAQGSGPRVSWAVLAVTLCAQILVVLDISVVNTALPSIADALGFGENDLQAVVTAYLMVSGGALLLGGRISDLVSRRGVFLTGLAMFTLASLASGFATDATWLITTRAIQGLSAAVLTPSALSLIMTTYEGDQRRKGLAAWGVVGSIGVAAGVLVGGALTTWMSWQLIFWVNVPIGGLALLAGLHAIPRSHRAGERARLRQFDLPGAAAVIAALSTLVFALSGTSTHGWTSLRTLVAFTAAAALLTVFLLWERRASEPLFPPHVWGIRTLVSGTTVMLGITGILVGVVFLTSILLQAHLGYSALKAGVAFLPFALAITVGAVVARHALAHLAPRAVATLGLLLTAGRRRAARERARPRPLRAGPAARPGRAGSRGRDGVRAGLGQRDGRHPREPRRTGLWVPDDWPRGWCGPRCRGPLRSRERRRQPHRTRPRSPRRSPADCSSAPASRLALAVFAWLRMPAAKVAGGAGAHMHH